MNSFPFWVMFKVLRTVFKHRQVAAKPKQVKPHLECRTSIGPKCLNAGQLKGVKPSPLAKPRVLYRIGLQISRLLYQSTRAELTPICQWLTWKDHAECKGSRTDHMGTDD